MDKGQIRGIDKRSTEQLERIWERLLGHPKAGEYTPKNCELRKSIKKELIARHGRQIDLSEIKQGDWRNSYRPNDRSLRERIDITTIDRFNPSTTY